jgi:hypothetical protein
MSYRMTVSALKKRARDLWRGESGIALPVALLTMVASVALAGAAVVATVDVQRGTSRDSGSKSAIAAADAGANLAVMRLARYAKSLSTSPCLKESNGVLVTSGAEADGWCPALSGNVGGANYVYRASPAGSKCGSFDLCVVATGTVNGVSRRIEINFNESTLENGSQGENTEGTSSSTTGGGFEGMVGKEGIELSGNADIRVGIGSDGNIVSSGNSSICGDIRVGIGKKWTHTANASQCSGYKQTEGNLSLPPVTSFMPSNIATVNSNNRITMCKSTNNPVECQQDGFNGTWSSTSPFDPTTRVISLAGNTTLSVTGGDYFICGLYLSGNSELIMGAGAKVRFFFDTPEHCNLANGASQITLSGNNRIAATGYQPTAGNFDVPGFYLLGSTSRSTSVNLSGNYSSTNEFVLYGPNTNVNITGNATFKGLIAGRKVVMSGNGKFENDKGFRLPPELQSGSSTGGTTGSTTPTARYYTAQSYVECEGTATSPPNSNC